LHGAVRPSTYSDATYRYRLKDNAGAKQLRRMSGTVNDAWNDRGATQREAQRRQARRPSRFGLVQLMTGASTQPGIHSDTPGAIARQFVQFGTAAKYCPGWRSRCGQLGWVPFNAARALRFDEAGGSVVVRGRKYRPWFSPPLPAGAEIKIAAFAAEARGRWYFNNEIDIVESAPRQGPTLAIELGLKHQATLSDGRQIAMPAFYRKQEAAPALRHKRRATAPHAKAPN
jgi:hypothetical protein